MNIAPVSGMGMLPFVLQYADAIFPFIRDRLIAKISPQSAEDFWRVTHTVSVISLLIQRWSTLPAYQTLIALVNHWPRA